MRKTLVAISAIFLLVLFILSLSYERLPGEAQPALLNYVIDGDSLAVEVDGKEQIFRLLDIDAPEYGEPFNQEATAFLKSKLEKDMPLYFYQGQFGQDVYGRWLVLVWTGQPGKLDQQSYQASLNAQLVRQGLALPRKYNVTSPFFAQLESLRNEAEENKRGVHQP